VEAAGIEPAAFCDRSRGKLAIRLRTYSGAYFGKVTSFFTQIEDRADDHSGRYFPNFASSEEKRRSTHTLQERCFSETVQH
jgi:hypothetical protein